MNVLYGMIAARASRAGALTPMLVHVALRLKRLAHQLERLADRWRAGKLHPS